MAPESKRKENMNESEALSENREKETNLIELLYRLLENLKYIILALVAGGIIAGVYSFFIATPKYESTAKLYVLNSKKSVVDLSDLQIGSYLTADYKEVFNTWEVNEQVLQNLSLNYSYSELGKMVSVSNPTDTRILYITVTTNSAEQSAQMANQYAEVARQYISDTMQTETPSILSTALISASPVSPNRTLNILTGAAIGALLAIIVITVMFLADDKIKSEDDIMKYGGMMTLAIVPYLGEVVKNTNKKKRNADEKEVTR